MWYIADVFMKSMSDRRPSCDCLWEESILLLDAYSEEEACQRAELIARAEECEYETVASEKLKWVFVRVATVEPLDTDILAHGTELFSRFLSAREAESLLAPFDTAGPERG